MRGISFLHGSGMGSGSLSSWKVSLFYEKSLVIFHKDIHRDSSPSPASATRVSFLNLCGENLMRILEVKPMKVCFLPPRHPLLGVSHSHSSPHSASRTLSKLSFKCFYMFKALMTSASGRHILTVTLSFKFEERSLL